MKKIALFLIVLLVYGCVSTSLQVSSLGHESYERELLTEEEFMTRASRSAAQIYQGLSAISLAAEKYAKDHDGQLPQGVASTVKEKLLEGKYLTAWPVVSLFAFTEPRQRDFNYLNKHDDMDGIGGPDDIIFVPNLKLEVCEEFSRRYSSFAPDVIIHDFEAERRRYPGEIVGRDIKIFAISWSRIEDSDECEIQWVMKYND